MNSSQWINERARLNHDILCNQLLTEFLSLKQQPSEIKPIRLNLWLRQTDSYRDFINSTEDALDAGAILDTQRFSCWTDQLKQQFRQIAKILFSLSHNIAGKVAKLQQLLELCVMRTEQLLSIPQNMRTSDQFADLERDFQNLSKAISDLPYPIGAHRLQRDGVK